MSQAVTVRTDKLRKVFGQLDDTVMIEVNRALAQI
ncbi:hypothetical protein [uncultured Sulfitobacter sp.]|nr:hypothetical protein [uncultured Sulfitobacter sp.]